VLEENAVFLTKQPLRFKALHFSKKISFNWKEVPRKIIGVLQLRCSDRREWGLSPPFDLFYLSPGRGTSKF